MLVLQDGGVFFFFFFREREKGGKSVRGERGEKDERELETEATQDVGDRENTCQCGVAGVMY